MAGFVSGIEMTAKELLSAFEKNGLKKIDPVRGEKFDPHKHQAMMTVESTKPANTVVTVYQKGYLLNDRTLRPALVAVASAPRPEGGEAA